MENRLKILGRLLAKNSNVNSILLSLIAILMIIGDNISSIGKDGIEFKNSTLCITYELESTYWDVYADATAEIERSNTEIINMYSNAFAEFYGGSGRANATYRLFISDILKNETREFTLASVFRNHFPAVSDTMATQKHCNYVSTSGLYLTASEIDEDWAKYFPRKNRKKFQKYLQETGINEECIDKKGRSLLRIELMKLTIIQAIQNSYPDLTEQEIKRYWSTKQ